MKFVEVGDEQRSGESGEHSKEGEEVKAEETEVGEEGVDAEGEEEDGAIGICGEGEDGEETAEKEGEAGAVEEPAGESGGGDCEAVDETARQRGDDGVFDREGKRYKENNGGGPAVAAMIDKECKGEEGEKCEEDGGEGKSDVGGDVKPEEWDGAPCFGGEVVGLAVEEGFVDAAVGDVVGLVPECGLIGVGVGVAEVEEVVGAVEEECEEDGEEEEERPGDAVEEPISEERLELAGHIFNGWGFKLIQGKLHRNDLPDEGLVARGADGDDFDGDADVVFEAGEVGFGVGGQGVEGGALADVFMPAGEGFVDRFGFLKFECVGGKPLDGLAINFVGGADF